VPDDLAVIRVAKAHLQVGIRTSAGKAKVLSVPLGQYRGS
jgi:hypothetical protein